MKVPREQLEDRLKLIIDEYATDRHVHDEIVTNMENKNVPPGETKAILTQSPLYPLETMDIGLIYTLTKYFYIATGRGILNPENYFYENEITEGDKWKRPKLKDIVEDLKLTNFLQVMPDQWIGVLSSQQLGRLYNNGRILYRPETQRGLRVIKNEDSILYRIDYNVDAINNIADLILKGEFIPNTITLNVLQDGDDVVLYDLSETTLKIGETSEINVVDGFHRSYGLLKALAINPNLELNWEIRLVNWDVDKAKRFIYQEDYKTPLRKEYKESINQAKLENIVAKNLNEAPQNEMQFKIATDANAIAHNRAYVMFNTMAEAVRNNFEIKSQRDVRKITEYLVEFFNELVGLHIDEFNNPAKSQNKSFITVPNMFIGYITLAGKLYNTKNWQATLEEIMTSIDFTRNNPLWEQINITKSNLTRKENKILTDYFTQKFKEVTTNDQ